MLNQSAPADPKVHEAAIRTARRCRYVIQAVLREEEWGLADQEFYLIIRAALEQFLESGRGNTGSRGR